MMKRRDALKTLGGLAGGITMSRFLPGCGSSDSGPEGITTVVALMMENRSFDHMMGSRTLLESKAENGLTATMANPDRLGKSIGIWPATPDTQCVIDPPHGWDRARVQLDGGLCDGFVKAHQDAHDSDTAIEPMQYLLRAQVPTTYALADAYTLCNQWFCSVLGPTFPNREYWHTGQSNGHMDNTVPNPVWASLYDRLNAKGIDWAYYYGDVPTLAVLGGAATDGHIKRFNTFAKDCKAGTLPPVVYIDPAFTLNDDHPPHHPAMGQQLIGAIYTALATSPQWKNILFVVTYDENGGFFDHVAPPKAPDALASQGFDQLGFRVPALVMGPYARTGLSTVQYDHTSVLRHIEKMFELEPLTMRDAAATDLSDCIDQERLARHQWNPPADIPLVTMDEATLPPECLGKGTGFAPGSLVHHDVLEWADANPDLIAGYDDRGNLRPYLETIHEILAPHGAGFRWGR
jgi:phospholipase C